MTYHNEDEGNRIIVGKKYHLDFSLNSPQVPGPCDLSQGMV